MKKHIHTICICILMILSCLFAVSCDQSDEPCAHQWSDATCTTPKTCSVCSATEGEALGHDWSDAACTTPKTCSVCSATEDEALGHDWNDGTVMTAATCLQKGARQLTCSACDETKTEDIPATGHTHSTEWTVDVAATCTTNGSKSHHCANCTDKADVTVIPATGHTHSIEWTVDVAATCTTDGSKSHHCANCADKADVTVIPAAGHAWVVSSVLTEPTCTQNGVSTYICAVCSVDKTQHVSALGHDWAVLSEVPATLMTTGSRSQECNRCHINETQTIPVIDPTTLNMPIVYMNDIDLTRIPLAQLQKEDGEITVQYKYVSNDDAISDFEGYTAIKIQGSSSAGYPKKNFTVKLYKDSQLAEKMKVNLGWGKENKYCMKANYIDFSQARNIVSAQMFAQVVASRENINPGLENAPNYGVIDGYPVLVYLNGSFHGIYTMNIPKDEWLFAMEGDETSREALLMADHWSNSVKLKEEINSDYTSSGWEVEYCSTDDDAWIRESFNRLIALLNCGDPERIKRELPQHLDIEAAIDNMIFTYFINGADNTAKNVLWATFDGNIWIPSMYDMDSTFGIYYDGRATDANLLNSTYSICPSLQGGSTYNVDNKMYEILLTLYADEVEARYRQLRESILTLENTEACFQRFFDQVADVAYTTDARKWPTIPDYHTNRSNMYAATRAQLIRLDNFFYNFNQ